MIIDSSVETAHLEDLAEAGFPGLLLIDLVELTNDLMDRLSPSDTNVELWEVTCQAFNNAIVLAGRTSSVDKLGDLQKALARFHCCLEGVSATANAEAKKLASEYLHHTEKRQQIVLELHNQATQLSAFETHLIPDTETDELHLLKPR